MASRITVSSLPKEQYGKYLAGDPQLVKTINTDISNGCIFIIIPAGWTFKYTRSSSCFETRENINLVIADYSRSVKFTIPAKPGILLLKLDD